MRAKVLILTTAMFFAFAAVAFGATTGWVMRDGSVLKLNGAPFVFSGANIFWLADEQTSTAITYPTHFRVDDALATAQRMGANVVRTFACDSVGRFQGTSVTIEPTLGVFNPAAIAASDYAVYSASVHKIRLIMPLVDNYSYYDGGMWVYANWIEPDVYKSNPNQAIADFFTNPVIIKAYEAHIAAVLNHVNRFTGVSYKNDPTIMSWETGNELWYKNPKWGNGEPAPASWTATIANYIKSIAPHQLVGDGNSTLQIAGPNSSLAIANIDLLTGHYYPMNASQLAADAANVTSGGKAFFVGEYAWNDTSGSSLSSFLSQCESSPSSGDMFWSTFGHWDTYGYDNNGDKYTLHYPGDNATMAADAQLLRNHAFGKRGLPTPAEAVPAAPLITSVSSTGAVAWRGSVSSATYELERASVPSGGWELVTKTATDTDTPVTDPAYPGGSVCYRVRGVNLSGVHGPFSPVFAIGH